MDKIIKTSTYLLTVFLLGLIISNLKIHGEELKLNIAEPKDDAHVGWKAIVKGTISNPELQVFVAVHPMATDKFWIQPIPNISADGQWKAYCYFGEPSIGIGEPFEIIVVASKNKDLFKEGHSLPSPLPNNPQIIGRSNPVTVIRDK